MNSFQTIHSLLYSVICSHKVHYRTD